VPPLEPGALVHSIGQLSWLREIGKTSFHLSELVLNGPDGVKTTELLQATKKMKSTVSLGQRTKTRSWKVRVYEEEEENESCSKRRSSSWAAAEEPTVLRSIAPEQLLDEHSAEAGGAWTPTAYAVRAAR
jgi:hypothetical protein